MKSNNRFMLLFFAVFVSVVEQAPSYAATAFNVTNSGASAYVIDGASNPTLAISKGQTYTFNVNTPGHPFWITTARGAASASADAFSSGVTNNGVSLGTITFTVPAGAPSTLFYQCGIHDIMGGTLTVTTAAIVPASTPWSLGALAAIILIASIVAIRRRRAR